MLNSNLLFRHRSLALGITLVELLMTIALIGLAVLPIISALSSMTEVALIQRDKITGMTIGTLVMDSYIHRFQMADTIHPQGFNTYSSQNVVFPPVPDGNINLFSSEGHQYRDIFMNGSHYRTSAEFSLMDGSNGTQDLSTTDKLVYRIDLVVWRILHPLLSDDLQTRTEGPTGTPDFSKGDEIVYQLSSLYSQTNSLNPTL